jgi:hypothetical protein
MNNKTMILFLIFAILIIGGFIAIAMSGDGSSDTQCVHIGSNPCFPMTK